MLPVLANIQKRNTKILSDHVEPHVDLMNVFHGLNIRELDTYRNIVEVPELAKSVCIGGAYVGAVVQRISDMIHVVTTGHQYEQYHMLGIFNPGILPAIIRLANTEFNGKKTKLVTSDASTHVTMSMAHEYRLFRDVDKPVERLILGLKGSTPPSLSTNRFLPCQCPACDAIKYMDILGVLHFSVVRQVLMLHNKIEMTRYCEVMDDYAKSLSTHEYRNLVWQQLKTYKNYRTEADNALKLIEEVQQTDLKTANNKFKMWLPDFGLFGSVSYNPLLDLSSEEDKEEVSGLDVESRMDILIKDYTHLLDNIDKSDNLSMIDKVASKKNKKPKKKIIKATSHSNKTLNFGKKAKKKKVAPKGK